MTYLVTFLCLLAEVLEGLIARIKRAVVGLTPTPPATYITGTYPVYTDDAFFGIITILPLPSYHQRLHRGSAWAHHMKSHGWSKWGDSTPSYTPTPTPMPMSMDDGTHCMTNVVEVECEGMPSDEEQLEGITWHASFFEGEPTPATTHRHIEAAAYVCAEAVCEYEHMPRYEGMGSRNRAYKAHARRRTKGIAPHSPRPTYTMSQQTQAEVDACVLKREQEDTMWSSKVTLNTTAQMKYSFTYPPTEQDLDLWPDLCTPMPPVKDILWLMEQKRLINEMRYTPCQCGKALMGHANMCYECYCAQYSVAWADRVWESKGLSDNKMPCVRCSSNACSCEEDKAINDQAEYDLANGLCLNCHNEPCEFDCQYDEEPENSGVGCPNCTESPCRCGEEEPQDHKVCKECDEVIYWDGCLCVYDNLVF